MKISYDTAKNEINITKHGLNFEQVEECDWSNPLIIEDNRYDYFERRYRALLLRNGRVHNVVFTKRNGTMRIISFRKANSRERKQYEKEKS